MKSSMFVLFWVALCSFLGHWYYLMSHVKDDRSYFSVDSWRGTLYKKKRNTGKYKCESCFRFFRINAILSTVYEISSSSPKNEMEWFSSVQFSRSVVSNSLRPHESQHARPPCPSPTPRVHWKSRPLSWWCHPAISSSVVPFSSCPQSSQHQSLFQWVNS